MTGRKLNERLGKVQFWLLFIGTNLAFFPQHLLGLDGMIRRIADYSANAGWTELNFLSTIGAFIIAVSRPALPVERLHHAAQAARTRADDPWDANTLEWATTSPPPPYNFDSLPPIRSERPLFDLKHPAVPATPSHCRQSGATHDECAPTPRTPSQGPPAAHRGGDARCTDARPHEDRRSDRRQPGLIAPHDEDDARGSATCQRGMDTALLGMLLFIASEVMFFAALFGAYFNVRADAAPAWPPEGTDVHRAAFRCRIIATIILVTSSFTMQWGVWRIRKGDRTGMNRAIAVTLVLGIVFLCLQLYDYLTARHAATASASTAASTARSSTP